MCQRESTKTFLVVSNTWPFQSTTVETPKSLTAKSKRKKLEGRYMKKVQGNRPKPYGKREEVCHKLDWNNFWMERETGLFIGFPTCNIYFQHSGDTINHGFLTAGPTFLVELTNTTKNITIFLSEYREPTGRNYFCLLRWLPFIIAYLLWRVHGF